MMIFNFFQLLIISLTFINIQCQQNSSKSNDNKKLISTTTSTSTTITTTTTGILMNDNSLPIYNPKYHTNNNNNNNNNNQTNLTKSRYMMGYFHTQMQTPQEARINITNISPRLTHTIFAFAKVDGETSECTIMDEYYDIKETTQLPLVKLGNNGNSSCTEEKRAKGNFGALYGLKKDNPHMRILMSIGGASEESKKNFTKATSTLDGTYQLAKSCVKLAMDYGMDGIDWDWETPSTKSEWEALNELLKKTREELNNYPFPKRYLLSVALLPSAFKTNLTQQIMPKIANQLDFVNLMTYDASPGSDRALHNAPLFSSSESYGAMSINDTVIEALRYFPSNKVIIGQPLYGILTKTNGQAKDIDGNIVKSYGLFENINKSNSNNTSKQYEPVYYTTIRDKYLNNNNFTRYWDDTAKATWLYNNNTMEFLTYSDEASISEVLNYIESKDLGGLFFWQLGGSFNRQTFRDDLIEFSAGEMPFDYTRRATCAPQAIFCNIKSECPKEMLEDGTLSPINNNSSSINLWFNWNIYLILISFYWIELVFN